jgi:hypothetical protein
MPRIQRLSAAIALPLILAAAGPARTQTKIPVPGTDRYRVQYADSTVSINDLCPVLKKRLGARKMPIYVNGRPVGFC